MCMVLLVNKNYFIGFWMLDMTRKVEVFFATCSVSNFHATGDRIDIIDSDGHCVGKNQHTSS